MRAGPNLSKHQAVQQTLSPVSRPASDLCLPHQHQMELRYPSSLSQVCMLTFNIFGLPKQADKTP